MIDPRLFRDYPDLTKGDTVRYSTKSRGETNNGVGTVTLVWLGIEEMCDVQHGDGGTRTLCRALGDEIVKVAD